jgi:hypothetical protein
MVLGAAAAVVLAPAAGCLLLLLQVHLLHSQHPKHPHKTRLHGEQQQGQRRWAPHPRWLLLGH